MIVIGVPTVNGPERVFGVLRSIEENPPADPYKVVVVDDGSNGHAGRMLKEVIHVFDATLVTHLDEDGHPVNRGISAGWNSILREARAQGTDVAVILNDDVTVQRGSLDAAVYVLRNNPAVACAGLTPRYLQPSGWIHDWPPGMPADKPYRCLHTSGCSFAVKVAAWSAVHGFDEQYLSHYEDADFGVLLRDAGYVSVNLPQSVLHGWSKTFAAEGWLYGHLRLEVSRRRFVRKWGKDIHGFDPLEPISVSYIDPATGAPATAEVPYVSPR